MREEGNITRGVYLKQTLQFSPPGKFKVFLLVLDAVKKICGQFAYPLGSRSKELFHSVLTTIFCWDLCP